MENWLNYEKYIAPIIETIFETEKTDYSLRFRTIDAILYFKDDIIYIRIDKEYCKGEKFIAKNDTLQKRVDEILSLGFRYYSWVQDHYKKTSQLSISF